MFSNRVCVSTTHSLVLSELQSTGRVTTDPIEAHGLSWTFHFLWEQDDGVVNWRMGLDQPPDCMVGVAVRPSVVIESSRARCRCSLRCLLICTEAQHSGWFESIFPSEIALLVEDGALKMSAFLEVFKPVRFRSVASAATFFIRPPSPSCSIVGIDNQGSVYTMCGLANYIGPEVEHCVYSFRPCNPDGGVIHGRLDVRRECFKGCGFDRDNKKLSVTQMFDNNSSLQLDIFDCSNEQHTTCTYNIDQDQDLRWSAATPHKQGWLCIASGVREGPLMVYHRFWLLCDDGQLELLTELVQATLLCIPNGAASANGAFYCLVEARVATAIRWSYLIFVSSWEQPYLWQPYEVAPCPDFCIDYSFHYVWGHILVYGSIYNGPTDKPERQDTIFKLRFEGADCYLEPYVILPKGVTNWKIGIDGFVALTDGNKLELFGIQPPALKTRALMDVVKLLNGDEKLARLLGQATNAIRN